MTNDRRVRRRRFLQATGGAVTMTAIAGCQSGDGGDGSDGDDGSGDGEDGSNDGGSDGDSGDDATDTQTRTQTEESGVPGEVVESSVDGLSIVEHSGAGFVDSFRIEVTVENTGEMATNFANYDWSIAAYDSSDTDISTDDLRVLHGEQVESGDSASIILHNGFQNVDPTGEDVVRYELGLSCGDASEGEYCVEQTEEPTTAEETDGNPLAELPTYAFSEGESYTYDVNFDGTKTEETWTVTDVSGDDVTVERVTAADGETETGTYSASQENIIDTVDSERQVSYFPIARAVLRYRESGDLSVGNEFVIEISDPSYDWESETVTVKRETTIDGVSCKEIEADPAGDYRILTACIAEDYPFALSMALTQDGSAFFEMTMTDHTRP